MRLRDPGPVQEGPRQRAGFRGDDASGRAPLADDGRSTNMRLILTGVAAAALVTMAPGLSGNALAHGGAYRGPPGEIPPDSRDPADPPPPPESGPPGTPGGDTGGGPETGSGDVPGPGTGEGG